MSTELVCAGSRSCDLAAKAKMLSVDRIAKVTEVEALLKYQSANEFLMRNGFYVGGKRKDGSVDKRELTHTGMDLKRVSVPDEHMSVFLHLLARDIHNSYTNYFCELLSPTFRFFADFDMVSADANLTDAFFLDYVKTYQTQVMSKFFRDNYTVVVYLTERTSLIKDGARCWKYGMHLIWSDVVVKLSLAHYIHEMSLAVFKEKYPLPQPSTAPFDDVIDGHVYRDQGGLRMVGSQKMIKCPDCKRRDGLVEKCSTCEFPADPRQHYLKGLICVGRPYFAKYVVRIDGAVDADKTRMVVNNPTLALLMGHLRMPLGTPERTDFDIPADAPVPPQLEYEKAKITKATARLAAGTKNKAGNRVNAASEHFGRIWLYENNRKYLKNIKQKVYVDADSPALPMLQEAIRRFQCLPGSASPYHDKYQHTQIQRVFTNRKRSFFYVTVTGEGSFYCHNKRQNHTNSQIVFYINRYGEISQRCMSPKSLIRAEGVACCDYSSMPYALDPRVHSALTYTPPRHNATPQVTQEFKLQSHKVQQALKPLLPTAVSRTLSSRLMDCAALLLETLVPPEPETDDKPARAKPKSKSNTSTITRLISDAFKRGADEEKQTDDQSTLAPAQIAVNKNNLLRFGSKVLGKRKRQAKNAPEIATTLRPDPLGADAVESDDDLEMN